jgi:hypothetical protein
VVFGRSAAKMPRLAMSSNSAPPLTSLPPHARRVLPWLAALVVLGVILQALRTPLPAEDGVSYLWIAQQFAVGEWRAAWSTVFPPGYSLLCAPGIALGGDPEWVGIGLSALSLAVALWPIARLAELVAPGAGILAALLFATSPLLTRLAAENFSEAPFLLACAFGLLAGTRAQWWRLGIWAGVAFWIRPEGLLLPAAFVLARQWSAWRAFLPALAGVFLLGVARWTGGHGFEPLPIHGFHEQRDDLPMRGAVLWNLLEVPAAWLEAFGLAGLLPLGLLVPWVRRRDAVRTPGTAVLGWGLAMQIAVVCTFVVRRRFFVSAVVQVVVLAAAVLARLPRAWRIVLFALAIAIGVGAGLVKAPDPLRGADRDLGLWLRTQLQPGRTVTGDATRVVYYAGLPPLPPRHFTAEQLAAMAAPPEVQFVVLRGISQRTASQEAQPLLERDFELVVLPAPLADRMARRGLLVLARRGTR